MIRGSFTSRGSSLILSPFLILIEIASDLSRPTALGMRLAVNITAGHILLAILSDFSFKLLNLWAEITYQGFANLFSGGY